MRVYNANFTRSQVIPRGAPLAKLYFSPILNVALEEAHGPTIINMAGGGNPRWPSDLRDQLRDVRPRRDIPVWECQDRYGEPTPTPTTSSAGSTTSYPTDQEDIPVPEPEAARSLAPAPRRVVTDKNHGLIRPPEPWAESSFSPVVTISNPTTSSAPSQFRKRIRTYQVEEEEIQLLE